MQSVRCKQYIEAIKIAAGSVQYKNLSVKNTLIEAIQQLTIYYENSKNKEYLEIALLNIQAYLEMGFEYGESNPELEDNKKVQAQWDSFEATQHKRRRAFKKAI